MFEDLKVRLDALEVLISVYGDWSPFPSPDSVSASPLVDIMEA